MTLFREHGYSLKSKWGKESHVTSDQPDASIKKENRISQKQKLRFFFFKKNMCLICLAEKLCQPPTTNFKQQYNDFIC